MIRLLMSQVSSGVPVSRDSCRSRVAVTPSLEKTSYPHSAIGSSCIGPSCDAEPPRHNGGNCGIS